MANHRVTGDCTTLHCSIYVVAPHAVWVEHVVIGRNSTKRLAPRCRSYSRTFWWENRSPLRLPSLLGELVDRLGHCSAGVVFSWLVCPSAHGPRLYSWDCRGRPSPLAFKRFRISPDPTVLLAETRSSTAISSKARSHLEQKNKQKRSPVASDHNLLLGGSISAHRIPTWSHIVHTDSSI